LAVNVGAVAIPVVPVTALAVADPLNVPLAPLVGAAKVTVAPLTGLLFESFTVACRAAANAVPTVALCGVPPVAPMEIVTGAVFVRLKDALDAPFGTVAVTR